MNLQFQTKFVKFIPNIVSGFSGRFNWCSMQIAPNQNAKLRCNFDEWRRRDIHRSKQIVETDEFDKVQLLQNSYIAIFDAISLTEQF